MRFKLILFLCVIVGNIFSQQDLVFYHMNNVAQRNYINPAFNTNAELTIGIPVLSSVYFNVFNTVFTPKEVLVVEDGVTVIDIDKFLNQLDKNFNYLSGQVDVDFLYGAFAVKENYFSINWTLRNFVRANYPKALFEGWIYGNANFEQFPDGKINISKTYFDFRSIQEIGVSWSRNVTKRLRIGGRIKYLYGVIDATTKSSDLTLITDTNSYDVTFTGELDIRTSGIYSLTDSTFNFFGGNPTKAFFFGQKNHGMGLDFGFEYDINEKWRVSGSIKDFGFIAWRSNLGRFFNEDAYFLLRGIDLGEFLRLDESERESEYNKTIESIEDSLVNINNFTAEESEYTSWLPPSIYIGGEYTIFEKKELKGVATALFRGELYKTHFRPAFSLGYHQYFKHWLSASINYSMINKDFGNLGLSFSIGGPVQFYIVTDNILAAVVADFQARDSLGEPTISVSYPYFSSTIHARAGLNIQIDKLGKFKERRKQKKDQDADGISDVIDECPEIFGLKECNGCPDSDGDGIADKNDFCPQVYGVKERYGCPEK